MNYRFLGCLAFAIIFAAQPSFAQAIHGILKVVKGDVRVIQASDSKEVKAKIGEKVYPKDVIIAGADSRAKVVMIDNNELNISPDSKLEIQNYEFKPDGGKKNVLLNIIYGKVRAKVNQKYEGENTFQVKTPTAVAGVRGTDFILSFNPVRRESQVVTFHGLVAFGQPGPGRQILNAVFVSVGQTTTSNNGAPPGKPFMMAKNDIAKIDSQSDATKNDGDKKDGSSTPTNTDPKKDKEKNDDKKPDDGKSGANNNSKDKGPGSPGGDKRMPASPGAGNFGGPMIVSGDLPSNTNVIAPIMPSINLPTGAVPLPTQTLPPKNDFVNEVINSGNRKVTITITPGP